MEKFLIQDSSETHEVVVEKPQFPVNEYGKLLWSNQGIYKRKILSRPSINPSPRDQYITSFFPKSSNRIGGAIFKGDTWVREVALKQVALKQESDFKLKRIRLQARIDGPSQEPSDWLFYADYYPIAETIGFIRRIGLLKEYISLNFKIWVSLLSDQEKEEYQKKLRAKPEHKPKFITKPEPKPKEVPNRAGNDLLKTLLAEDTESSLSNVLSLSPLPFQISSALFEDPKEMDNFWMIVEKYISEDSSLDQEVKDDWKKEIIYSKRLWAARALTIAELQSKSTQIPSTEELEHYKLPFIALKSGFNDPLPSFNDHKILLEFLFKNRDGLRICDGVQAWKIMLAECGNHKTNAQSWRSTASQKFKLANEKNRLKDNKFID